MVEEVTQLRRVDGEDGAAGGVVQCQDGIQVVLAHVADGKGHSLLRLGVDTIASPVGGQGAAL